MEKDPKLKTKDIDPREYMTAEEIQKKLGTTHFRLRETWSTVVRF